MPTTAVLGAGSWGTALSVHLAKQGHQVRLWGRDARLVEEMRVRRANAVYLPDVTLPKGVSVTAELEEALGRAEFVVSAVPSHGCRLLWRAAAPHVKAGATMVSATKGLEADTLRRLSEVIAEEVGPAHPVVALSGPCFAMEVAQELPTVVVVASCDARATDIVQTEFRGPYSRLYGSDDVVGVEI
jgi:glycerol-3-phosphate dehydrogenase (NAD(P)+)